MNAALRWHAHPTRRGVLVRIVPAAVRTEIRVPTKRPTTHLLAAVARWIEAVVGDCVPDGDPIDRLAPLVRSVYGRDADVGAILDRAARKHLHVRTYNDYLVEAWDAYASITGDESPNPWRPQ